MNPAKAFALLNPKGANLSGVPGGGYEKIDSYDIAFALSGLRKGPYLMGLAKHAGHLDALEDLEAEFYAHCRKTFTEWKLPMGHQRLRRMCQLAIYETVYQELCKACYGRGLRQKIGRSGDSPSDCNYFQCGRCHGTGKVKLSKRRQSRAVGVSWSRWQALWSGRYEEIFAEAQEWAARAWRYLRGRINEDNR